MRYIKTYENNFNFEIGVFTNEEASELYRKYLEMYDYEYHLKGKIHYWDGFDSWGSSNKYRETSRFIIAYNDVDIIGISHYAFYDLNNHFGISYCSTNKDYFNKGISKKLLEETFKNFSEEHPNETLNFSGYSVDGWKYLRKYILELSKKYNVNIFEKGVEYPGLSGKHDDEFFDLMKKSREEVIKKYGKDKYYY